MRRARRRRQNGDVDRRRLAPVGIEREGTLGRAPHCAVLRSATRQYHLVGHRRDEGQRFQPGVRVGPRPGRRDDPRGETGTEHHHVRHHVIAGHEAADRDHPDMIDPPRPQGLPRLQRQGVDVTFDVAAVEHVAGHRQHAIDKAVADLDRQHGLRAPGRCRYGDRDVGFETARLTRRAGCRAVVQDREAIADRRGQPVQLGLCGHGLRRHRRRRPGFHRQSGQRDRHPHRHSLHPIIIRIRPR